MDPLTNQKQQHQEKWTSKKSLDMDDDVDEDRSDTSLLTTTQGLLSRRKWHNTTTQNKKKHRCIHARLLLECVLVVLVIGLSASLLAAHNYLPSSHNKERFGPSLPEKQVKFGNAADLGPKLVYADNEMLRNATRLREVHENWQALFPKGRGYIVVDESTDQFTVHNPAFAIDQDGKIGTVDGQGKGWIMSVYHQLHCLSIITSRMGIPHHEFATWDDYHLNHVSHCVEYLRQAILCNADTSLEGETGAASTSTGWGQMHVCKDFDALLAYGNEHAAWDLSAARVVDLHAPPGTTGRNQTTTGAYGTST